MWALDQQCFMISCAPAQNMESVYHSGNSMIAGPDGAVVCQMGIEDGIYVGEINLDAIKQARAVLSILNGRRTDLYDTVWKG